MILRGPDVQHRRGHSFGRIHKSADVGSWMRSRNHMLDLSLTGFDPKETLTFELRDHDRRRHLLSEISGKCGPTRRLFLALRPPKLSRGSTEHITEMTR